MHHDGDKRWIEGGSWMETIMITVKTDNDKSNDRKSKNKNDTCNEAFQKGGGRYWLDTIMIYNVTKLMITMA